MWYKIGHWLLLLFLFVSCSNKDVNKNCSYLPVIVDQAEVLNAKTHSYFKNANYPKGIVPILYTVDSIPQLQVASYADAVFDSIASNSLDKLAFEKRGLLLVVSHHPLLIQARIGTGYSVYCKMKGVTSGYNYVTMQHNIGRKGLDEMLPQFVHKITNEIEAYRELSWIQKKRIRGGLQFISEYLKEVGTPSDSFFDQFYFTPFVRLTALLYKLTHSWFISFFIIASGVFFIGNMLKKWITNKMGKRDLIDIQLGNILSTISQCVVTFIISFPTIAAITILSNARMEDKLVLEAAHIPFLDIIDWTSESNNIIPSLGILVILGFVFYGRYLTRFPGYLSFALLPSSMQGRIYNQSKEVQEECKALLQGGFMRKRLYGVFLSIFHIDDNTSDTEVGPDPAGQEGVMDNNITISDSLNKVFFHHEKGELFMREPFRAIISNRHREAIVYVFLLMICASVLFTKPLVMCLLALWFVSFVNRCIIDYKVVTSFKKKTSDLSFGVSSFLKKYLLTFSAFVLLFCGIMILTNPFTEENPVQEVNTNIFDQTMLVGLYNVKEMKGDGSVKGVTARISYDENDKCYNLKIYSNMPTALYQVKYDSLSYSFFSEILGKGAVNFDKELDKVTIKFEKGWIFVK